MPSFYEVHEQRTVINRMNAQKSTGPRTAAGKARSSGNARKHGLTGEGVALPVEDAQEVQARFDMLAEELCPVTAEEVFFVRRAALQTLRVDRCYEKEAHNLKMAVRDAIPNHDKKLFDEFRAVVDQFPEDPYGSLHRLKQTAPGVDFMIDHWRGLRDVLAESGNLTSTEVERAEQLQGRRIDASGLSPIRELSRKIATGLERADGQGRPSPDQADACKARSKLELEALLSRQIENLLIHRATLPLADAERSRQEAPMRAVVDLSNQGQLLRRYETAAAREVTKIFVYFNEKKAQENADEIDVTISLTETPGDLASFRNLSEPVVETVSNPPSEPLEHPVRPVERPLRE